MDGVSGKSVEDGDDRGGKMEEAKADTNQGDATPGPRTDGGISISTSGPGKSRFTIDINCVYVNGVLITGKPG